MLLVFVTACLAVCGAAKLDKTYLPPLSAKTAGGSSESLLAPIERINPPIGSYENEEQGVVVDAVAPGTRTGAGFGVESTGLGGPRVSYGSTNSKVGDAAFTASVPGFKPSISTRIAPGFHSIVGVKENVGGPNLRIIPGVNPELEPTSNNANTLKFDKEINKENYHYGFQTDNGISVGENGVSRDGIEANGGYSYKGDDGKVYSVSYTADKDGYKPKGSHLPTPPPIPVEIVKSLEDNAKDEAEGIVDDGSYDAHKYNIGADYSSNNDNNNKYNPPTIGDHTSSKLFVTHSDKVHHSNLRPALGDIQSTGFSYGYNVPVFSGHAFENKYNSATDKKQSDQGQSHVDSSEFGLSDTGFNTENAGISFFPHATNNRYGDISDKSDVSSFGNSFATAVASTNRDLNDQRLPNLQGYLHRTPHTSVGNSAYSSATAVGSGSASAVASTLPIHPTVKNYNPFDNRAYGDYQQDHKFETSVSKGSEITPSYPSITSVSATVSENLPNLIKSVSQSGVTEKSLLINKQSHNSDVPAHFSSGGPSVLTPTKVPSLDLSTPFDPKETTQTDNPLHLSSTYFGSSTPDLLSSKPQFSSSTQKLSQSDLSFKLQSGQYNLRVPQGSFDQTASTLEPNPAYKRVSDSYHYNQPLKPFRTPVSEFGTANYLSRPIGNSLSSVPLHSSSQKSSSLFNVPSSNSVSSTDKDTVTSQFGQNEKTTSSSYYNGVTQASAAPFPSNLPIISSPLKTQSALFSTEERTQFGQTIFGPSQLGGIGRQQALGQKKTDLPTPLGSNQQILNKNDEYQLQQGTIYEYNKPGSYKDTTYTSNIVPFEYFPVSSQQETKLFQGTTSSKEDQTNLDQKNSFGKTQVSSSFHQTQFYSKTGSTGDKDIITHLGTGKTEIGSHASKENDDQKSTQQYQGTLYQYNKPIGSTISDKKSFESQVGQKSQPGIGSTATADVQPVSVFGTKSFNSHSTTDSLQSTQKGLSSLSQFGQTTGAKGSFAQQNTDFGQQPSSLSQTTGSTFSQTAFGSTYGSQFEQKPQAALGTKGKTIQSVGSKFPQTNFDSTSVTQFGTKSQSGIGSSATATAQVQPVSVFDTKSFGAQSTTGSLQSTQKGSSLLPQFGQTTGAKDPSTQQNTGYGQQPSSLSQTTGSTFSQTAFGSTYGSQFEQKPQAALGTKGKTIQSVGSNFPQTNSDSTSVTQFEPKSQSGVGSSATATAQVQPVSVFGTKSFGSQSTTGSLQSTQKGSSSLSQFGQTTGAKGSSTQQKTGFGQQSSSLSQNTGSTFSQTAFGSTHGSQFEQKPQAALGTKGKTIQSVGSNFPQTNSDSTSVTQFGPKSQSGVGSSATATAQVQPLSVFGTKSFGTQSTTGSLQSTQKGSSLLPQFGQTSGAKGPSTQQNTGFGQQPPSFTQTTGSTFSQTAFGNTYGSQFEQKPQAALGTKGKTIQSVGSNFPQTNSDSTSVTQFGPKSQSGVGSSATATAQVQPVSEFGTKSFGSQSTTGSLQSTQKGSSSLSQFGQTSGAKGSSTPQNTGFGQQPSSLAQNTGSTFSQTAFGSTYGSQFEQKPQAGLGTKGKTIQSVGLNFPQTNSDSTSVTQFGPKSQSGTGSSATATAQVQPVSVFGTKSSGSQSTTGSLQSTQKGYSSLSQFGQTTGAKASSTQQNTGFGQQPSSLSQTTGSTFSQTAFGSTYGSQFELKPQAGLGTKGKTVQSVGSNFPQTNSDSTSVTQFGQKSQSGIGSSATATAQAQPLSVFGTKSFGSQSTTGSLQSTRKGSSSLSQFGQTTGTKGPSTQQNTGFGQQPSSLSQTTGSSFSQTAFGSTYGSQFEQKPQAALGTKGKTIQSVGSNFPQTNSDRTSVTQFGPKSQSGVGSSATATAQAQPLSVFGAKSFDSQSATGLLQSNQKGSSSLSQFGQTSGTKYPSTQQNIGFGQQPSSLSQNTGSSFSQTAFGSTYGSQFEQKPQAGLGTKGKTIQSVGSNFPQTNSDSTSVTQFGPKSQSGTGSSATATAQVQPVSVFGTKSSGSQSTTGSLQSTQKGYSSLSQFGQTTGAKASSTQQNTGFGQQPSSLSQTTGSTFSQTAFGSTYGSQFELKPQAGLGTKGKTVQSVGSNFPQTNSDSTSVTQFGQKSQSGIGSSATATAQAQPLSVFGTKSFGSQSTTGSLQSTRKGSSSLSQFGQTTGTKGPSTQQNTGFGQQPSSLSQTTGSSFSQTAFGSTYGSQFEQKPQAALGTKGKTIQSVGSNFPQTNSDRTSVTQFGPKSQSGVGSSATATAQAQPLSMFGAKSFDSQSATGLLQSNQKGSSSLSQFGQTSGTKYPSTQQNIGFGQQPSSLSQNTGSSFSQTAFGSTYGSQFEQKPQAGLGTKGKTIQSVGSNFPQTNSDSTSVTQFGPKSQSGVGSSSTATAQAQPLSVFGTKSFDSQSATGLLQSNQKGSSSLSQFAQTTGTKGPSTQQNTGFGQQPSSLSQIIGSRFSQTAFGSTYGSQFEQKPQAGLGTKGKTIQSVGSNFPQTNFDSTSVPQFGQKSQSSVGSSPSTTAQIQPVSVFGTKSSGSQFTTGSLQSTQKDSSSLSQFGQTSGTKYPSTQQNTGLGRQPSSLSQNSGSSFSQTAFGSTYGSQFEQKPQAGLGTKGKSIQSVGSNFPQTNSDSTSVTPFGPKSQSGVGSSATATAQAQPLSVFGTKSFDSQSATGLLQSNQKGSSSLSQFAQTTGTKGPSTQQNTGFGQQPSSLSQTTGSTFSQTAFGSTYGSQFEQKPQAGPGTKGKTIQSVGSNFPQTNFDSTSVPQFGQKSQSSVESSPSTTAQIQPVSVFGTKSSGSQFTTGSLQSTQKDSSSLSQFGQTSGTKYPSTQQNIGFGQQPSSLSQNTGSSFSQTAFGSTYGSQFEQKPQAGLGTKGKSIQSVGSNFPQTNSDSTSVTQFGPKSQSGVGSSATATAQAQPLSVFGTKSFDSQSATGLLQSNQKGSSSLSQFAQTTGTKGPSTQQNTGFGQHPSSLSQITGSTFSQTAFGSTYGSQFEQKPQAGLGTKGKAIQSVGSNFPQTNYDSTSVPKFGQKSQSSVGSSPSTTAQIQPVSVFGTKSPGSQFTTGSLQSTQKDSSSLSQFGQTSGTKYPSTQQNTGLGRQPSSLSQNSGSSFSQTAFGSTYGSQFDQKPLTGLGTKGKTISQIQPVSQSATGSLQLSEKSSSPVNAQQSSNFGQKIIQSSQALGFNFPQKGHDTNSVSQFELNSQHIQNAESQFGQKTDTKSQSGQQFINFSQKSSSPSQITGSSFSVTSFGSTPDSQFEQHLPGLGTSTGVVPEFQSLSQYDRKPFGSQSLTGSFHSAQTGSSLASKFGQTKSTQGQSTQQTTVLGQQPSNPFQTTGSTSSQTTYGSAPGSQLGQKPQVGVGTTEKTVNQIIPGSLFVTNGVSSQSITGSLQSTEKSSYPVSQTDYSTGQSAQKAQSIGSQFSTKLNKPFINTQSSFLDQYKYISEVKPYEYKFTQFEKIDTQTLRPFTNSLKYSTNTNIPKPDSFSEFGSETLKTSATLDTFGNSQSIGSSQLGIQPSLPTGHIISKSQVVPSTQISFENLQSAKAAVVSSSSQLSGLPLSVEPLRSSGTSSFGLGSFKDTLKPLPAAAIAETSVSNENKPENIFVGNKELFGGPREPPKFDVKTGYHY